MNLYTMILLSFLLVTCVDEVVENRTNCQVHSYVYFFQYLTFTIIYFMNGDKRLLDYQNNYF